MAAMEPPAVTHSPKSGVLARTVTIIDIIVAHTDGLGVREAARRTGIDRSAVSRILNELETLGYVAQDRDRGVYSAGAKLFSVAATLAERDSIARASQPLLSELVEAYHETCFAVALVDNTMVVRAKLDGDSTVRSVIELGASSPLVMGAPGLAILSALEPNESERMLAQPDVEAADVNLPDLDAVRRQLVVDQQRGYSYSAGRDATDGAGIAAPFFDAAGRCAGSITLSGPTDRVERLSIDIVGAALVDVARRMSERLGHLPDD